MRPTLAFALALLAAPVFAQDRAATEQRLAALQEQIAGVEAQIHQARSEEEGERAAVEGLATEIQLREALVEGYKTSLDSIRAETEAIRGSVQRLEGEIEEAKSSYRQYARHAYMRGRTSELALILSAGSLPQMIARARYIRQFAQRRRRQVERIASKTVEMRVREQELGQAAQQTQRLLTAGRFEQAELAERRRERETLAQQVRRRRGRLEADLQQRRSDAAALEGLIRDLAAAERRRAEEARRAAEAAEAARREAAARQAAADARVETPGRTAPPRATPTAPATPEAPAPDRLEALSGSFRSNRGRLPWPADGTVTGRFGTRTDPVYNTRIEEVGIDITTAPGAGVRAVFDGVVERVAAISAYGTYVVVSHGDYHTLYGNLSQVTVRQGQQIRAGQSVGRAGRADARRGVGVFFALFDGGSAVNPVPWLRGR